MREFCCCYLKRRTLSHPLIPLHMLCSQFGTLWNSWESTTFYESRYTTVDYCHRLFEVLRFLFVATEIAHIGSVDLLSDPRSPEAMIFCVAALGEGLMHLGLNVELLLRAHGDRDAVTNHTERDIMYCFRRCCSTQRPSLSRSGCTNGPRMMKNSCRRIGAIWQRSIMRKGTT